MIRGGLRICGYVSRLWGGIPIKDSIRVTSRKPQLFATVPRTGESGDLASRLHQDMDSWGHDMV